MSVGVKSIAVLKAVEKWKRKGDITSTSFLIQGLVHRHDEGARGTVLAKEGLVRNPHQRQLLCTVVSH
jgi:hypothetical protein